MKKVLVSVLLSGLMVSGAYASDVVLNDQNIKQVRDTLSAQGYKVAKVKKEDGFYEAYARKDGKKIEVLLNADFQIVRTEMD